MTKREINQYIGKQIKKYRKIRNVDQETLADFLEVTRTSMVNIEQGRQAVDGFKIWRICSALRCHYTDLLPPLIKVITEDKIVAEEVIIVKPARVKTVFVKP